jgi:hypothetical protein
MKDLILCSMSGGGGRFPILLDALNERRAKGLPEFDAYAGCSSGLLACICDVMGIGLDVYKQVVAGKVKWLKRSPKNKNGGVSWYAIWCMITNKPYLGIQQEDVYIRQWITPKMWDIYCNSSKSPVYGLSFCIETEEPIFFNIKGMEYEDMVKWVSSSCRVPMQVQSVLIDGLHYADGGIIDHNPSQWLMAQIAEKFGKERVSELWSYWTTPYQNIGYPTGFWSMLDKTISTMSSNNSFDDWEYEELVCKSLAINRKAIRMKDHLNSPYDTNLSRLLASVEYARKQREQLYA